MNSQHHSRPAHRARLYTLLSLCFDRPGESLQRVLDDDVLPDVFVESTAKLETTSLTPAASDAATAVSRTDFETFRSAYGTAFGVEGGADVSPYETEYRPGGLVTNTDELADIAGFYDAFGLEVGEQRDRVDHLATELEFVGELAAREAHLADAGDGEGVEIVVDAQRLFLEDHLGRWVPRVRTELEDEVGNGLYLSLAKLLDELVSFDTDRLGASPDVLVAERDGPLESLFADGDGDWRCDTCVGDPSSNNPMEGEPR